MLRWTVVSLLALVIYLQGSSALFSNTAECQEALVVWEMVDSGNWVLPRVNGELIPSKPPLYHWIALGFSWLTGEVDERSVRLPSIVAAALGVGLVFAVAAHEWGTAPAVIASVALATSPEWVKWATTARTDATFALLLCAALLLGHRWLRSDRAGTLLALAAVAGAATLAKGFAAAALVGIVMAIEIWWRAAWRMLRVGPLVAAAAIFAAVACSWYAAALAQAGFAFFHKQIVLENVLRFLPNEEGGPSRQHSLWFYVPMLFRGMLPWSIALPHALLRAYRERRSDATRSHFCRYLLVWFTVVFVVCTLASGKRSNYLLPLYPAAALLVGWDLGALLGGAPSRPRERVFATLGAAGAILAALFAGLLASWRLGFEPWSPITRWLHPQHRILLPRMVELIGEPHLGVIAVLVALAMGFAVVTVRRRWKALAGLVGATLLIAVFTGCRVLPGLQAALKSFAPFSRRVDSVVGREPLRFFRAPDLAVLFYLRRHVPVERAAFQEIGRPAYALVWQKDWEALSAGDRQRAEVVETSPPASVGRPDTRLVLVYLAAHPE